MYSKRGSTLSLNSPNVRRNVEVDRYSSSTFTIILSIFSFIRPLIRFVSIYLPYYLLSQGKLIGDTLASEQYSRYI